MNSIMKKYIPGLSMGFFATVFISCCMKLIRGDDVDGFAIFIIEFTGYLIVAALIDALIGKIDFKNYLSNFICEVIALYPITLLFAWFGNWFGFRIPMLFIFTILFIMIMALIHIYFYFMVKKEASKINQFIKEREDK